MTEIGFRKFVNFFGLFFSNQLYYSGTGTLNKNSKLSLSELNIGLKCVADIRSAGITATVGNEICQLDIFPVIDELQKISIHFPTSNVGVFQE